MSPLMVIQPKIRGFVCVTSHPQGCAANIGEQIAYVKSKGTISGAPKKVLVVGCSTGYGLASRIAAAFAGLAIGVLLHNYGVPGVAAFIGVSMVVGICMILLGPSTKGLTLEKISH